MIPVNANVCPWMLPYPYLVQSSLTFAFIFIIPSFLYFFTGKKNGSLNDLWTQSISLTLRSPIVRVSVFLVACFVLAVEYACFPLWTAKTTLVIIGVILSLLVLFCNPEPSVFDAHNVNGRVEIVQSSVYTSVSNSNTRKTHKKPPVLLRFHYVFSSALAVWSLLVSTIVLAEYNYEGIAVACYTLMWYSILMGIFTAYHMRKWSGWTSHVERVFFAVFYCLIAGINSGCDNGVEECT